MVGFDWAIAGAAIDEAARPRPAALRKSLRPTPGPLLAAAGLLVLATKLLDLLLIFSSRQNWWRALSFRPHSVLYTCKLSSNFTRVKQKMRRAKTPSLSPSGA